MSGSDEQIFKAHVPYAPAATFGTRKGIAKPNAATFMKRGTRTQTSALPSSKIENNKRNISSRINETSR